MLDFDTAQRRLLENAQALTDTEWVPTAEAAGRVLALPVCSQAPWPSVDCAKMDGYALRSSEAQCDPSGRSARLPVSQRITAGSVPKPLTPLTVARIFTGAPLPEGADAVIMQENAQADAQGVSFSVNPTPGLAIRYRGSDVAEGETVLTPGTVLRAPELALAASVGMAALCVFRRLRVGFFSTGNEIVMPGEALPEGGLYNASAFMVRALVQGLGCDCDFLGTLPDSLEATRLGLRKAAQKYDVIITTGGVSVGEEDHVRPALEAEGEIDFWSIAMKPGKPVLRGCIGQTAVVGLPGNPISSFVSFVMLARPFLLKTQGVAQPLPAFYRLPAGFHIPTPNTRRAFLRARIDTEGRLVLHPNQDPSALVSAVWAEGLVEVPENLTFAAGQPLRFFPYGDLMGLKT
jgi:molybdopterin molybdotransferase